MKKILGTIFLIAFMTGTLITGLGCTPKEEAGGDPAVGGGEAKTPAEQKQEEIDKLTEDS